MPQPNSTLELTIAGYQLKVNERGGTIRAPSNADPQRTEEIRSGPLEGLALHTQGKLVLHGSCVCFGRNAVCIIGASGSGKSTLAAELCCRGASFISDGMTAVDPATLGVSPGPARAKLNAESLLLLGQDPSRFPLVHPASKKHYVPVQTLVSLRNGKVPSSDYGSTADSTNGYRDCALKRLRLILVVEDADQTGIVSLGGARALIEVIRNVYLVERLPANHSPILMRRGVEVLERGTEVKALRRAKQPGQLVGMVEAIERQLVMLSDGTCDNGGRAHRLHE